jgi:hypothetical protein
MMHAHHFSNPPGMCHLGSGFWMVANKLDLYGRMGQDLKYSITRIPQFSRGVTYRIGFHPNRKPPATSVLPSAVSPSVLVMANRGRGFPNRIRGTHGRGGGGWSENFAGGRGPNFHEEARAAPHCSRKTLTYLAHQNEDCTSPAPRSLS